MAAVGVWRRSGGAAWRPPSGAAPRAQTATDSNERKKISIPVSFKNPLFVSNMYIIRLSL